MTPRRVGVLALQGAFAAHAGRLHEVGATPRLVRTAHDCEGLDGLVLPGGESTAMLRLLGPELRDALDRLVATGVPVLATCAGLILAARAVEPAQRSFGWLDVGVKRNGWGRQVASARVVADDGGEVLLIRAPRIVEVGEARVERTLAGEPLLVRQGAMWGATYHPELGAADTLHAHLFA